MLCLSFRSHLTPQAHGQLPNLAALQASALFSLLRWKDASYPLPLLLLTSAPLLSES